jgi:hypothetical protein
MYSREHVLRFIPMVESCLLSLGVKAEISHTEEFGLDNVEGALEAASKLSGWGGHVILKP